MVTSHQQSNSAQERLQQPTNTTLTNQQSSVDKPIDEFGTTRLIEACKNNKIQDVKNLLADGANVNAKDNQGRTPLHWAKSAEIAQLLIAHDADVNAESEFGTTPLHWAENAEIAQLLIAHGATVNARNADGITPLHWARNDSHMVQVLIKGGANVNITDKNGETPLHWTENAEVAKLLINAGADVKIKDNEKQTPQSHIEAKLKKASDTNIKENLQGVLNVINQAQPDVQKGKTTPEQAPVPAILRESGQNISNEPAETVRETFSRQEIR